MALDTILEISGPGIADYSCRGAVQSLDPIAANAITARTINFTLIDLSPPGSRKYKSTISCKDWEPPAFGDIWTGIVLIVDCIAELGYPTFGGSPPRPAVFGSERTSGAWTYFRPQLEMMVMSYTLERDEYGAVTSWQLQLEET